VSEAGFNLVARGDIRDALMRLAQRSTSPATLSAVVQATAALVLHQSNSIGIKQLFVVALVRDTIAGLLERHSDPSDTQALLRIVVESLETIPTSRAVTRQLFADPRLHGAFGLVRDRCNADPSTPVSLTSLLSQAMEATNCPPDVAASTPEVISAAATAAATAAASVALTAKRPLTTPSATPSAKPAIPPLPTATIAALVPVKSGVVDDFLDDEDLEAVDIGGGGAVDDFLDGDDADFLADSPKPAPIAAAIGANKASTVDDFLDDDD
jgi:hypothetical protein